MRTAADGKKAVRSRHQPLYGVRVLVGRARHQAGALSSELRKLGAEVIEIPFIEIHHPRSFKALDEALKNIREYDWLILTSVNGVEAMFDRLAKLGLGKWEPESLRVAAIGPATKKALEKRGTKVDVVPKEYVAESVVRSLKNRVRGKRVLLVRAKVARDVIPRELRAAGAEVNVVEAYETVVPARSSQRLRSVLKDVKKSPHVVTFTSSSTVQNFVALLDSRIKKSVFSKPRLERSRDANAVLTASIGPVTSSTLRELGLPVDIAAKEFTIPGLVKAIVGAFKAKPRPA